MLSEGKVVDKLEEGRKGKTLGKVSLDRRRFLKVLFQERRKHHGVTLPLEGPGHCLLHGQDAVLARPESAVPLGAC